MMTLILTQVLIYTVGVTLMLKNKHLHSDSVSANLVSYGRWSLTIHQFWH